MNPSLTGIKMEILGKEEIKAHILKRIQEYPFKSKYFYMRQLPTCYDRFRRIVDEMVKEGSIVERTGLEMRKEFIGSRFKPKKNVKYLMLI